MKTKNYLLVIFTLISFSISAQVKSTKKKKPKGIIVKNNEIKTNQLVRDFLKNRESKGYKFWRILNGELLIEPYNSSSLQNHSLDRKKNYNISEVIVFLNNEIILSKNINNITLLNSIRMNQIKTIKESNQGLNNRIIYINTI